jgi:hypothetical protein
MSSVPMTSLRTSPSVSLTREGSDEHASHLIERIERYYKHVREQQQQAGMAWHAELLLPNGRSIEPLAFGFDYPALVLVEGREANGSQVRLMLDYRTVCLILTQRVMRDGEKPADAIRFDHDHGLLGSDDVTGGRHVGGFSGQSS